MNLTHYFGTLTKVYDNETKKDGKPYWTLVINTDAKGEVKFNLWDTAYAGLFGAKGEPAICDVHDLIDKRVVFTMRPGKVKNEETGERWPGTVEMICEETGKPEKTVREMAEEIEEAEHIQHAAQQVEDHTVTAVGCDLLPVQKFLLGVRNAADEALAEISLSE